LLGGGSLPEREWDHADGHKQNQVKGASKKMRFDFWISLFFQFLSNSLSFCFLLSFTILLRDLPSEVLEHFDQGTKTSIALAMSVGR
jgi:hypothetical protein